MRLAPGNPCCSRLSAPRGSARKRGPFNRHRMRGGGACGNTPGAVASRARRGRPHPVAKAQRARQRRAPRGWRPAHPAQMPWPERPQPRPPPPAQHFRPPAFHFPEASESQSHCSCQGGEKTSGSVAGGQHRPHLLAQKCLLPQWPRLLTPFLRGAQGGCASLPKVPRRGRTSPRLGRAVTRWPPSQAPAGQMRSGLNTNVPRYWDPEPEAGRGPCSRQLPALEEILRALGGPRVGCCNHRRPKRNGLLDQHGTDSGSRAWVFDQEPLAPAAHVPPWATAGAPSRPGQLRAVPVEGPPQVTSVRQGPIPRGLRHAIYCRLTAPPPVGGPGSRAQKQGHRPACSARALLGTSGP